MEGLLLSAVSSGKFSQLAADKTDTALGDANSLSLQEFSALFVGQLPQQLDLKAVNMLSDSKGQSLPISRADGTILPPKTIQSILNMLSDPVQAEKLGFTETQLVAIKDILNSDLRSVNPALLNEKINELLELKSPNPKIGELVHRAKETVDLSVFKEAVMDIVKSYSGQKGRIESLLKNVNYGQLPTASNGSQFPVNLLSTADAPLNPVHNQLMAAEHQTRPSTYVQTVAVDTQLGRPQWSEAFNSRVLLLAQDQVQSAQIKLNPAELGPVEIRLVVKNDQTHIHFMAQHGDVREIIEDAFPRLREMMGQSGVNLGDVNVSQHSASEQSSEFENELALNEKNEGSEQHEEHDQHSSLLRVSSSLVDEIV